MSTSISQTCMSEGRGYYFPPCHILDISGVSVLVDCPMDLSSLTIFSPLPVDSHDINIDNISFSSADSNEENRGNGLVYAEPRYRTVTKLHSWNISFIDVVLITSPIGMLGLPFLTRKKGFTAKVYATKAASRIGQLMMEDLVYMHKEFRQFYGPESDEPIWMKWDRLEMLPLEMKKIVFGADETDFGCWMPLFSAADVKACMLKVESLNYAEEICYNGILIVKPLASGLEIGSCNWRINGPRGSIAYISSSVFRSAIPKNFDYDALQASDVVVYSDFFSLNALEQVGNDEDFSGLANYFSNSSSADVNSEARSALLSTDDYLEEIDKLDFICSCSMDSIKAGGSILIPTGRLGIILQLLERFELHLTSENMKVPIFVISSVAEQLMIFTSIIPEWLGEQCEDRFYSEKPSLFTHTEMLKDGRLHLFPAIHSDELLNIWQEPCIVFCPHWSLRLGPVTHLLRRWRGDQNSLLVIEEGVDANLILLPFKPIAMKVVQCSFLSGMQLQKSLLLLKILQPKHVLFPEIFRRCVDTLAASFSSSFYNENEMLHIPYTEDNSCLHIDMDLARQIKYTKLEEQNVDISRLKGKLMVKHGRYKLCVEHEHP
ncbi:integrator complex subunit 9-like [Salvia splendens]|uniref:integrator complex subunit 9-like n=1 Tax=Salvia splendens TaxID=180675 RepID=UPI001C258F8C|nr:integrator complex subunit 9-like [Salvia splendens]